jgi:hypothetical protein
VELWNWRLYSIVFRSCFGGFFGLQQKRTFDLPTKDRQGMCDYTGEKLGCSGHLLRFVLGLGYVPPQLLSSLPEGCELCMHGWHGRMPQAACPSFGRTLRLLRLNEQNYRVS